MTWPRSNYWTEEKYSDEDCLTALRCWANPDGTLSSDEYEARRLTFQPSGIRIVQRFETWNRALRLAGLKPRRIHKHHRSDRITEAHCLTALRRVSALGGGSRLAYRTYEAVAKITPGLPSPQTIRNRIGPRWSDAKDKAGIL